MYVKCTCSDACLDDSFHVIFCTSIDNGSSVFNLFSINGNNLLLPCTRECWGQLLSCCDDAAVCHSESTSERSKARR